MDGLSDTLGNKFHLQHNEMIKCLQNCKLSRQDSEKTKKLMGRLRVAVAESKYKKLGDLSNSLFMD